MAKGPSYTDEEQKLLDRLAKKGGSPTVLAKEFIATLPESDRAETALVQKIRKLILEIKMAEDPASVPPPKKRGPRVNAAALLDQTARRGRRSRAKESATVGTNGNGHSNGHANGSETISVDLGGLTLIGSRKRVGEALQQLG